ncbi:Ras-related protein Rab-10 [Oopsacas minuta]|uniref:Ras-related protein Rab-10 n=1 Tax=Oopsacas minuta TaxID=111878 RepID=A0AAV7K9I4_9METZ|nr:Ras-related protein Rab-10 [Oopsacas minuta]
MCANRNVDKGYDKTLKLIVIGHTSVGKTSVISSFSDNSFKIDVLHTVGVDYQSKVVKWKNESIKLQIWDTAGQERFRTLTQGFYRGAAGILVIFDITETRSFDQIPFWVESIHENCPQPPVVFIIGNKIDLTHIRAVAFDTAEKTAQQYGLKYMECSAKMKTNINEIFRLLVETIMDKKETLYNLDEPEICVKLNNEKGTDGIKKCCL